MNGAVKVVSALAAALGLGFLAWILFVVLRHGATALNWTFLTSLPSPPGVSGG
jgi:ABC-type phosphate transport system permease subunit